MARLILIWKLLEEPKVVLVEEPDVFDLIPQDRYAFDADAPGEARVCFGVIADRFEDGGMDHAAAENLEPAAPFAHLTTGAVARPATDVHFGARLGVRKEAGTEPEPRPFAEHIARPGEQRPFQVGQGNPFADD